MNRIAIRFALPGAFLLCLIAGLCAPTAAAQTVEEAHRDMRRNLVLLEARAVGTSGPNTGIEVSAKGTGFIVSNDGYILTTYHILEPIEDAGGVNLAVHATLQDGGASRTLKATVVNASRLLDVLLLKVPPSLNDSYSRAEIGESKDLVAGAEVLTSGFHEDEYFSKPGTLSNRELHHWKLNLSVVAGHSGSPVYGRDGNVVGIVKGNLNSDPSIGIMVPIELADPVITSIRNAELRAKLDWILARLGEIPDDQLPIHKRLLKVENGIRDVSKHMTWEAGITPNFDMVVKYKKIVSGKPHVKTIDFAVTPYVRYSDGQILKQRVMEKGSIDRNSGPERGGGGEFLLGNLRESMEAKLKSEVESVAITGFLISVVPKLDNEDGGMLDPELFKFDLENEFKIDVR